MLEDLPPWMFLFWFTAIGLFVGSFLNVAIHRLPIEGESVRHRLPERCAGPVRHPSRSEAGVAGAG